MSERRPPRMDEVEIPDGEGIHTFSNGEEWYSWADRNCYACRWWDEESIGSCALEGLAFIGKVSPALAALFGWTQDPEYPECWRKPKQCAFFAQRRGDGGEDDRPVAPTIDPAQLTFLPPDDFAGIRPPLIRTPEYVA